MRLHSGSCPSVLPNAPPPSLPFITVSFVSLTLFSHFLFPRITLTTFFYLSDSLLMFSQLVVDSVLASPLFLLTSLSLSLSIDASFAFLPPDVLAVGPVLNSLPLLSFLFHYHYHRQSTVEERTKRKTCSCSTGLNIKRDIFDVRGRPPAMAGFQCRAVFKRRTVDPESLRFL